MYEEIIHLPRTDLAQLQPRRERALQLATAYFEAPERAGLLRPLQASASVGNDLTDYYVLHRYVTAHRPGRVLECGSGRSSLVIAHALREVHLAHPDRAPGHLDTMEDLPVFHADVQRLCPADLAPYVTFRLSEKVRYGWRGLSCAGYAQLPAGPFDVVYLDGPTDKIDGRLYTLADPMRLAEQSGHRPFDLITDFKLTSCVPLSRYVPAGTFGFDQALQVGVVRELSSRMLRMAGAAGSALCDFDALEALGIGEQETARPAIVKDDVPDAHSA